MSLSVPSQLFRWQFRTQYCKTGSEYNFVCWYVCTEGLVSLHNSSVCMTDTLSIVATPQKRHVTNSGPHIHVTKSFIVWKQIMCCLRRL